MWVLQRNGKELFLFIQGYLLSVKTGQCFETIPTCLAVLWTRMGYTRVCTPILYCTKTAEKYQVAIILGIISPPLSCHLLNLQERVIVGLRKFIWAPNSQNK